VERRQRSAPHKARAASQDAAVVARLCRRSNSFLFFLYL
jgi:hypothetical protein